MSFEPVVTMLVVLFLAIAVGVPIAASLILATVPVLIMEPRLDIFMLAPRIFNSLDSFVLLAVPFFLLAGNLMNETRVTERLTRLAYASVGHLRGGLAHINILVSMLFAGISGSSTADTAGVGAVLIPAMREKGYDASFSVAVTAASSVMGAIIPPSILMVVWGAATNTSIAQLFAGGVLPGLAIGFGQMAYVAVVARRRGFPVDQRKTLKEFSVSFLGAAPGLLMPIIIVGGIISGIVTPTEASVLAVLYAVLLGFVAYRTLRLKSLFKVFFESAKLVSLSLFCLGAAGMFGWLLAYYQVPRLLVDLTGGLPSDWMLLSAVAFVCLMLGTFLDAIVIAIIVGPLFLPSITALGVDPVQYGIVACVALSMGLITPPYGLCLLMAVSLGEVPIHRALPDTLKLFGIMCLILVLIIVTPAVTLAIPTLLR